MEPPILTPDRNAMRTLVDALTAALQPKAVKRGAAFPATLPS
jgi:hypothetical protein